MNSQFTLCAFSDEAGADLSVQIRALKENGIGYMEARGVSGKNISDLAPSEAKELKETLASDGLAIWSIGSPLGKISIDDSFAPHMEMFCRTLDTAVITGARCIRLFSFYIPSGQAPAAFRDEVMERLQRFCEKAEGSGVVLCHENEKGIYGDNAERCADIHKEIGGLKAIFDPANYVQCGQDTIAAWKLLSPYVYYMHIKDALMDGKVVPPGRGDGQLPYLLEQYAARGGGVLTIEPHLSVFDGLKQLEQGETSIVDPYAYPSQREAFDAAVKALKALI